MNKTLTVIRSPVFRGAFLCLSVLAAVLTLWLQRTQLSHAVDEMAPSALLAAALLSVGYVGCTMMSWRAGMNALGAPLGPRLAAELFFLSQIAKYLPGGVWNVLALAELGRQHRITRSRSFIGMLIFWLVAVTTGLVIGAGLLLMELPSLRWLVLLIPLGLLALSPPVLTRILDLLLRLLGKPSFEVPITWRSAVGAVAWALLGWALAGAQVHLLIVNFLPRTDIYDYLLATAAYAIAWVVGFLAVFAPAGAGVREVVMAAALAGALSGGQVVLVVLASRVLVTLADLVLALASWLTYRLQAGIPEGPGDPTRPVR